MKVMPHGVVPHPAEAIENYRAAGYWRNLTIGDELHLAAQRWPANTALVSGEGRLTYAELDQQSDRLAAALIEQGVPVGAVGIFQLGNELETAVAFYGATKAGIVPLCSLATHRAREIDYFIEHTGASVHFVQADFRDYGLVDFAAERRSKHASLTTTVITRGDAAPGALSMADLISEVDAGRARTIVASRQISSSGVGVFQLSGGTTGTPKIIPRFHSDYVYNARSSAQVWEWGPDTVVLRRVVLMHNAGLVALMLPCHVVGATAVLSPLRTLREDLALASSESVTFAGLGGPGVREILEISEEIDLDLSHLEFYVVSGIKVSPDDIARLEDELHCRVLQQFGMAEGMIIENRCDDPEWMRFHTVGYPVSPGDEVRILAPDSEVDLPVGEVGELACRGPYTLRGYFKSPAHNDDAFTSDGFYRSGDLAVAHDVDGVICYSIEGRIKDLINRGGEKISALEVEDVLLEHPAVHRVAIVAMPDDRLGERMCAYVIPAADNQVTLDQLCSFLLDQGLAKFKLPERLELVSEFPLTNVGKVSKKALREDAAQKLGLRQDAEPTGATS